MIFVVFSVLLHVAVNMCINYSSFTFSDEVNGVGSIPVVK